ncbi:C40 family peptidase [Streptosporangium sandarakinum]|uniref:C40 family peptidase n=1 Tax=Streptosporangium sandarakinum TaxID=1260955 RepID=UPI0033ADE095
MSSTAALADTETGSVLQVRSTASRVESPVAASAASAAHVSAKKTAKAKKKTTLSRAALQKVKAARAVSTAKKQVGDPYRWGASGPGAFDCSGLVRYAWRKAGVSLPRVTTSQYRSVRKKVSWSSLRPGDLLFFYGKGHVGMYVGKGRMVHSPSSGKTVRVVPLKGYYRSAFSGAVRPGA